MGWHRHIRQESATLRPTWWYRVRAKPLILGQRDSGDKMLRASNSLECDNATPRVSDFAVTRITGVAHRAESARMVRKTSMPSSLGITLSVHRRSRRLGLQTSRSSRTHQREARSSNPVCSTSHSPGLAHFVSCAESPLCSLLSPTLTLAMRAASSRMTS